MNNIVYLDEYRERLEEQKKKDIEDEINSLKEHLRESLRGIKMPAVIFYADEDHIRNYEIPGVDMLDEAIWSEETRDEIRSIIKDYKNEDE